MKLHAALILTTLLACEAPAFADTIGVHVRNVGGDDLDVIVYDQNRSGQVAYHDRLNQGSSAEDFPITMDGSGKGSVTWQVVPASGRAMCGSKSGLGAGSDIDVDTSGQGISPC
jgi:hypothetical protein